MLGFGPKDPGANPSRSIGKIYKFEDIRLFRHTARKGGLNPPICSMARKKQLKTKIRELFDLNNLKFKLIAFKSLLFYALIYGLILNYSLWVIFGLDINWYTFPAYGIMLYFLKSEFIYIVRWCFHKIPGIEQ